MSGPDLSDYAEVPDRIREFFTKHPDGSLRCEKVEYKELPAAHLKGEPCLHIIYHALAYRSPTDPKPGQGKASEPIPGLTQFTKGSELMNAETSAWGRALVALGFVSKKVASANEVRARQDEGQFSSHRTGGPKLSEKQKNLIKKLVGQKQVTVAQLEMILADLQVVPAEVNEGWVDNLTGGKDGQGSALIDRLMNDQIPEAKPLETPASDVPSGEVPTHAPQDPGPDIPWEANAA